jgi:GTP cyclohydrolase III
LLINSLGLFSDEALQFLIDQINDLPLNVRAVFAGAETGVELADQLSEAMNLRTNGTAHSEERRNKFAMGEAVRNAGIGETPKEQNPAESCFF